MENIQSHCIGLFIFLTVFLCDVGFLVKASSDGFKFVNPPFLYKTAIAGSSITINCTTNKANVTTSLYFRSSSKIKYKKLSPSLGSSSKVSIKRDIYTIQNVDILDGGYYKCRATDSSNQTIEWPAGSLLLLQLKWVPRPAVSPNVVVHLREGQDKNFTCETVVGLPGASLIWYKSFPNNTHVEIPNKKTVITVDTKTKTTKSTLMITNAAKRDSIEYSCTQTYHGTKRHAFGYLFVHENSPPQILQHSLTLIDGKYKQEAKLECTIKGFPDPTVKWYKGNKEIAKPYCSYKILKLCLNNTVYFKGNEKYYKTQLIISKPVYPEDHGVYYCKASDNLGTVKAGMFVYLLEKPALAIYPSVVAYHRNQSAPYIISCKAVHGNPPPKFTWEVQPFWKLAGAKPKPKFWRPLITFGSGHTQTTSTDQMTSILVVPWYMLRAFYKCTAINAVGQDTHIIRYYRP